MVEARFLRPFLIIAMGKATERRTQADHFRLRLTARP
jgi:hypothetical protein